MDPLFLTENRFLFYFVVEYGFIQMKLRIIYDSTPLIVLKWLYRSSPIRFSQNGLSTVNLCTLANWWVFTGYWLIYFYTFGNIIKYSLERCPILIQHSNQLEIDSICIIIIFMKMHARNVSPCSLSINESWLNFGQFTRRIFGNRWKCRGI